MLSRFLAQLHRTIPEANASIFHYLHAIAYSIGSKIGLQPPDRAARALCGTADSNTYRPDPLLQLKRRG